MKVSGWSMKNNDFAKWLTRGERAVLPEARNGWRSRERQKAREIRVIWSGALPSFIRLSSLSRALFFLIFQFFDGISDDFSRFHLFRGFCWTFIYLFQFLIFQSDGPLSQESHEIVAQKEGVGLAIESLAQVHFCKISDILARRCNFIKERS